MDIASDFSLNFTDIYRTDISTLGGIIVKEIEYKAGTSDYSATNSAGAYLWMRILSFFQAMTKAGSSPTNLRRPGCGNPIGSDSWDVESFFTLGGNQIKRGYFINHWTPATNPLSQIFSKKIHKKGSNAGNSPGLRCRTCLDAAIKKAGRRTARRSAAPCTVYRDLKGSPVKLLLMPKAMPENRHV